MRVLLALLLLAGAAYGAWAYYQHRLVVTAPDDTVVHQDTAPTTVSEAMELGPMVPKSLMWKQDARWLRAEDEGHKALERARELYLWHEEVGGDPLYFRSEKEAIYEILQPIVEDLRALQAELAHNPGAQALIEQRLSEFSAATSGVLR